MTEKADKVEQDAQDEARLEELEKKGKRLLDAAPKTPEVKTEPAPDEMSPEDATKKAESIQAKKARIAQVLSRGFVNDKLAMAEALPKDRRGFWVRERQEDIDRMRALGGRLEERPADTNPRDIHGTGDNRVRVGDVVLMSLPREDYDLIQQVRSERKQARSGKPKREYLERAAQNRAVDILDAGES